MAKKKKKSSWKKKLGKAALVGLAGYAAYKGLKGKGKQIPYKTVHDTGAVALTPGRTKWSPGVGGKQHIPDTFNPDFFAGKKGGRAGKKHGGRTGKQFGGGLNRAVARPIGGVGAPVRPLAYKHGGKVKSMGIAKRGGGIAKK